METSLRGVAAYYDGGARPRTHSLLARRARRVDRAPRSTRTGGGRARAYLLSRDAQRHLRLVLARRLVHDAGGQRHRDALPARQVHGSLLRAASAGLAAPARGWQRL